MHTAIVIATTPTSQWLPTVMESLSGYDKHRIIVLSDYSFELGKLHFMLHHTDIDEFVLLHDSCFIKDVGLFDVCFETHKNVSVAFSDCPTKFGMYLGKYRRITLGDLEIPLPTSKKQAVEYEVSFNQRYCQNEPGTVLLFNDFRDGEVFEEKLGRVNKKLENDYLIKWKATWTPSQLES